MSLWWWQCSCSGRESGCTHTWITGWFRSTPILINNWCFKLCIHIICTNLKEGMSYNYGAANSISLRWMMIQCINPLCVSNLLKSSKNILYWLERLRLVISFLKSSFGLSRSLEYLWVCFDTCLGQMLLSWKRLQAAVVVQGSWLSNSSQSLTTCRFYGSMMLTLELIPWARVHMCPLQNYLLTH